MRRRDFLASAALAALVPPRSTGGARNPSPRKPNILLLIADQFRHDALGCARRDARGTWLSHSNTANIQTPALDDLAAGGIRFAQAVCNAPVCCPSRHSFITGLYPHETGVLTNIHRWTEVPPVPTLANYLDDAGYDTAAMGKMHWRYPGSPLLTNHRGLRFRASYQPGFEDTVNVEFPGKLPPEERQRQTGIRPPWMAGETAQGYLGMVSSLTGDELIGAWLASQAVKYLKDPARKQKPFFLVVSFDRPHPPDVIPKDYRGRYNASEMPLPPLPPPGFVEDDVILFRHERMWRSLTPQDQKLALSRYLTNVTYIDALCGKVLKALHEQGQDAQTLVFFFSDHGDMFGERGGAYSKSVSYDSAIRAPLIMRAPRGGRRNVISNLPVELVDLVPTALDFAGIPLPPILPGRSLKPLFEGDHATDMTWRPASITSNYRPLGPGGIFADTDAEWAVRGERYKLICRFRSRSALYDLEADPNEFENRIADDALRSIREHLQERLLATLAQETVQFPARYRNWIYYPSAVPLALGD